MGAQNRKLERSRCVIEPKTGQNPMPPPQQPDKLQRWAPYLVGRCRRGIVGSSRYAQRLREQIRQAAADPKHHRC